MYSLAGNECNQSNEVWEAFPSLNHSSLEDLESFDEDLRK